MQLFVVNVVSVLSDDEIGVHQLLILEMSAIRGSERHECVLLRAGYFIGGRDRCERARACDCYSSTVRSSFNLSNQSQIKWSGLEVVGEAKLCRNG
jgi:hypothetical protein